MVRAILVGSRPAWAAKLVPHLRAVGIDVQWHWEKPGATRAGFPVGAALVLITTDCNAHALSAPALSLARAVNIPVIHIPHRWSAAAPVLARAGWVPIPVPSAPAPVPSAPAPVEVPVLDLVPSLLPKFPPAPTASPLLVWIPAEPTWVRDHALKRLAADPQLTSRELAAALNISEGHGSTAFAAARKMLTIRGQARSVPARVLDMDVYRAWCAFLKIDPVAAPEPEPETPPAPMPAPMLAPPPPAPMPAPEAGAGLDASVGAACSLLLAAMRAANVTQISVTAAGDVSWTRLVVTTGSAQVSE